MDVDQALVDDIVRVHAVDPSMIFARLLQQVSPTQHASSFYTLHSLLLDLAGNPNVGVKIYEVIVHLLTQLRDSINLHGVDKAREIATTVSFMQNKATNALLTTAMLEGGRRPSRSGSGSSPNLSPSSSSIPLPPFSSLHQHNNVNGNNNIESSKDEPALPTTLDPSLHDKIVHFKSVIDLAVLDAFVPKLPLSPSSSSNHLSLSTLSLHSVIQDHARVKQCGLMLQSLGTTVKKIRQAVLELDTSILGPGHVTLMLPYLPSSAEVEALRSYLSQQGDPAMLSLGEQFFIEMMDIPNLDGRLQVMKFKGSFRAETTAIASAIDVVKKACDAALSSDVLQRSVGLAYALEEHVPKCIRVKRHSLELRGPILRHYNASSATLSASRASSHSLVASRSTSSVSSTISSGSSSNLAVPRLQVLFEPLVAWSNPSSSSTSSSSSSSSLSSSTLSPLMTSFASPSLSSLALDGPFPSPLHYLVSLLGEDASKIKFELSDTDEACRVRMERISEKIDDIREGLALLEREMKGDSDGYGAGEGEDNTRERIGKSMQKYLQMLLEIFATEVRVELNRLVSAHQKMMEAYNKVTSFFGEDTSIVSPQAFFRVLFQWACAIDKVVVDSKSGKRRSVDMRDEATKRRSLELAQNGLGTNGTVPGGGKQGTARSKVGLMMGMIKAKSGSMTRRETVTEAPSIGLPPVSISPTKRLQQQEEHAGNRRRSRSLASPIIHTTPPISPPARSLSIPEVAPVTPVSEAVRAALEAAVNNVTSAKTVEPVPKPRRIPHPKALPPVPAMRPRSRSFNSALMVDHLEKSRLAMEDDGDTGSKENRLASPSLHHHHHSSSRGRPNGSRITPTNARTRHGDAATSDSSHTPSTAMHPSLPPLPSSNPRRPPVIAMDKVSARYALATTTPTNSSPAHNRTAASHFITTPASPYNHGEKTFQNDTPHPINKASRRRSASQSFPVPPSSPGMRSPGHRNFNKGLSIRVPPPPPAPVPAPIVGVALTESGNLAVIEEGDVTPQGPPTVPPLVLEVTTPELDMVVDLDLTLSAVSVDAVTPSPPLALVEAFQPMPHEDSHQEVDPRPMEPTSISPAEAATPPPPPPATRPKSHKSKKSQSLLNVVRQVDSRPPAVTSPAPFHPLSRTLPHTPTPTATTATTTTITTRPPKKDNPKSKGSKFFSLKRIGGSLRGKKGEEYVLDLSNMDDDHRSVAVEGESPDHGAYANLSFGAASSASPSIGTPGLQPEAPTRVKDTKSKMSWIKNLKGKK